MRLVSQYTGSSGDSEGTRMVVYGNLTNFRSSITLINDENPAAGGLHKPLLDAYRTQLKDDASMEFYSFDNETMSDCYIRKATENLVDANSRIMAGVSIAQEDVKTRLTAWFNNEGYHTPLLSLNLAHTAILGALTGNKDYRFTVGNYPLPADNLLEIVGMGEKERSGSIASLGMNLVIGTSFLGASFLIFLVKERVTDAKHLQFVSGANSLIYWLANFLWDFANFMLPLFVVMLMFYGFKDETISSTSMHGHYLFIFLVYTWAMLPFMYLFSFLYSNASSGFTKTVLLNFVLGKFIIIVVLLYENY